VELGCIELHPHAVRSADLGHPDKLQVDLDPGVGWADARAIALEVKAFLEENRLVGWPKTSGSRGIHINVRIEPRWTFTEVRGAALALSRAIERRVLNLATSEWWKEERRGVFLDYNQNVMDRTTASAYSVRPVPDARVSAPLHWDEVSDCDPAGFTMLTMPQRFAEMGDPHADMDSTPGSLKGLLEFAARDEADGLADAPWPPHFHKMQDEAARVAPSRARSARRGDKPAVSWSAAKVPRSEMPLPVIANSPSAEAAEAGLGRWKNKHPDIAALIALDDVLIDRMRGRSSTWTRIRVNLRHVPEDLRPQQETPDPDDDPTKTQ
jgi:bifunctional non-homologous end joining protein LigD